MALNKYLVWFIIGGLLLALLIPFIVATHSFFPFITGKNFAFRIITELVFGLWIILALRDPSFRPKFSWLLVALLVFLAFIGVADMLSPNAFKSFWSNFERMEGYITLLHLGAYFLVASSVLNNEKRWTLFFQTSVGVSVIMSIYCLLQLAGKFAINQGGVRVDGTLGNAAYLAAFMLINFFFALFLLIRSRKSIGWKWAYGFTMALQFYILYRTETRGAMLGLLGGMLVAMVLLTLFSANKIHRRIGISVIGTLLVIAGGITAIKNTDFVRNNSALVRLTSISRSEAGPRFMVWNMALQGFKESPKTMLLGWGQESFNYVFNKYYDQNMYSQEQWFDRTHNVIFDWLIAGGALGLLAYLSLIVLSLYYIWKQGQFDFSLRRHLRRIGKLWRGEEIPFLAEKSILTGLLAAYVFQNLFVFDNITSYLLFFALLAYLHSISSWPIKWLAEGGKLSNATVNRVLAPIVVVITIFVVYVANVPAIRASSTLIDALQQQQGGPATNLGYFKKALSYNTLGNSEIREQLTQAALQIVYSQSVDLTLKQQYYDTARSELLAQIERTPNDARYYLFLGSFLNRARNYDDAITVLTRALELSPKKQTIMFELGSAYLNKGDVAHAVTIMKQAYDLQQDFGEARIIYAVVSVFAKDFTTASQLMAPFAGSSQAYDDRLVQAYTSVGRSDIVVSLLQQRVAQNPQDSQARFTLAAAYLTTGARQKAIETLQYVVANFPSEKDKANYYIQEIKAGRNP